MKSTFFFILICIAFTLTAQNNTIEWRNNRTGIYNETGLLKFWPADGPKLLWSYEGLGDGYSSVTISNDKMYVTGMTDSKGYLYVFDLTGKLLNKKEYGPEWTANYAGSRGAVSINDGKLYIFTSLGNIYCLNEQTLDIVWQKDFLKEFDGKNLMFGINESVLIVDEKLILTPGGGTNNIVALNKTNGNLIWSSKAEGSTSSYCSPLYISDQQIPQIVTVMSTHIVGINVTNGEKLWSYPYRNERGIHINTPLYSNNMLLCTSGYKLGSVMLRLSNGGRSVEKVWESPDLESKSGAMVKIGNYVYGSGDANNRSWFCLDWNTGETKYKDNQLGNNGVTISADGMLYCYTENRGEIALVKVNPDKFDLISKFSVTLGTAEHWAHPVIYKGVLYVRHGNALMAYKIN